MEDRKKNIVIIDSCEEEGIEFIKGLEDSTGEDWHLIVENSNDRRSKVKELLRYFKYFWVPLKIFISRKDYNTIVTWQQFYGIVFAFYCRFFKVKKVNKLLVMSFIYKEKKGFIGKIYKKFINYIVTSEYVDVFFSVASVQCEKFNKLFGGDISRFQYLPWGITDLAPKYQYLIDNQVEPYFFCAGRSNRDWNIVFESFGNAELHCKFIYSDASYAKKFENIKVISNIPDNEYFSLSINSYCVVISIADCGLAGGEITILNAMQFGKPVILIQDEPHSDYVFEGKTGFVVPKDKEAILKAARKIMNDKELHNSMALNARKYYKEKYSIYSVGTNISKVL